MDVIIDTCCFLRGLKGNGVHSEAIERLKKKCDTIIASKEIIKEYKSKTKSAGMAGYILERKIEDLKNLKKFKLVGQSKIEANLKNQELNDFPNDRFDKKIFKLAIAMDAKCIITIDSKLIQKTPYRYDRNKTIPIIRPEEYER